MIREKPLSAISVKKKICQLVKIKCLNNVLK